MWAEVVLESEEYGRYVAGALVLGGLSMIAALAIANHKERLAEPFAAFTLFAWASVPTSFFGLIIIRILHWVFTGE